MTTLEDIARLRSHIANIRPKIRVPKGDEFPHETEAINWLLKVDAALCDFAQYLSVDEIKKRRPPLMIKVD
jgi:hypothetical protein